MKPRERKAHWLGKTNGGEMPRDLIYLGVSSEIVSTLGCANIKIEAGRKAHLLTVGYGSGEPVIHDRFACGAVIELWEFLANGLHRKAVNWCYVRGLHRAMTLLRGWELAEHGGLKILAACLADPPCWVRCSLAGRTLLIVDSRNCGDEGANLMADEKVCAEDCTATGGDIVKWFEAAAEVEAKQIRAAIEPIYLGIHGLGGCGWRPTISGLAWSLYRRHFIPETDAWVEEREAMGGAE
jgi:hypothetical protein